MLPALTRSYSFMLPNPRKLKVPPEFEENEGGWFFFIVFSELLKKRRKDKFLNAMSVERTKFLECHEKLEE
jgi:hypothetical protein